PTDPPPLPFQLQDPERVREALTIAGLRDVRVETITETTQFGTGEALWDWLVSSNPVVQAVLDGLALTAEETDEVRRALDESVRERAGGEGSARLTNPIN